MKRFLIVMLALLMLFTAAACGKTDGGSRKDDALPESGVPEAPAGEEKDSSLTYTLTEDGSGYIVKGAESSPETSVVVDASYQGKPVVEIAEDAFHGYRQLSEVSLPDGLLRIDGYAFHWCEALTEIRIPASVQSIGRGAFRYSGLKNFTFPDGITVIEEDVFYGVQTLEYVVIPASVTLVRDAAFDDVRAMTAVYFCGTQAQWDAITFEDRYDFYFQDAKKYFYSESRPDGGGDFWHYADGIPTPW